MQSDDTLVNDATHQSREKRFSQAAAISSQMHAELNPFFGEWETTNVSQFRFYNQSHYGRGRE